MRSRRLGHQPALSGLRGIAVLAVLYHHLPTEDGPRGYGLVGVCVFFAMSGFLLTALLHREWDTAGAIGIGEFYRRRVVRLLPAMAVMVLIVVVWARLLGFDQRRPAMFSLLYVSNWARINNEPMGVFAHMWTLAVEVQFYLVVPVLFLATMRFARGRWAVVVTAALAAVIAAWRAALWLFAGSLVRWADGGLLIYVTRATDARLDAILIGAAAAFLFVRTQVVVPIGPAAASAVVLVWLGWANPEGDAMIVAGMAVASIAAAVLILHLVTTDSRMAKVLGWRPIATLGLISYSLYLWHLPVYKFLFYQGDDLPWWLVTVAAVTLTFALASASYLLVERPFLGHRRAPGPPRSTPVAREPVAV